MSSSLVLPSELRAYQYTRLTGSDDLRLIIVQPSAHLESPLECELLPTSLRACRNDLVDSYTALSYAWGDSTLAKTITVYTDEMSSKKRSRGQRRLRATATKGPRSLLITKALDSALRHLRDKTRSRRIWADGICINQDDIVEKNTQVAIMGEIYAGAHHTVIYLDEGNLDTAWFLSQLPCSSFWDIHGANSLRTLSAVVYILSRAWFRRVWVLQELIRSPDPWIQCGVTKASWNDLYKFILDQGMGIGEEARVIDDMAKQRERYQREHVHIINRPPSSVQKAASILSEILHARRSFGVGDPRDMLFAHVGLVGKVPSKEPILELIQVDYNKQISEVFTGIAIFLSVANHDYHIFSLLGSHQSKDLPSWVPDWMTPRPEYTTLQRSISIDTPASTSNKVERSRIWLPQDGVLAFKGYTASSILSLSQEALPNMRSSDVDYKDKIAGKTHDANSTAWTLWQLLRSTVIDVHERCPWRIMPSEELIGLLAEFEKSLILDPGTHTLLPGGLHRVDRLSSRLGDGTHTRLVVLWMDLQATLLLLPTLAREGLPESGERIPDVQTQRVRTLLIQLTLVKLRLSKDIFHRRRLATLENGTRVLVPESTEMSDVLAVPAYDASQDPVPLILRPLGIKDRTLETRILARLGELPIEHFNFIGECFVENLVHNAETQIWRHSAPKQFPKDSGAVELILALH
jgi:hypothetical protein